MKRITNILILAAVAYVIYKMFFVREGFDGKALGISGVVVIGLVLVGVIVYYLSRSGQPMY